MGERNMIFDKGRRTNKGTVEIGKINSQKSGNRDQIAKK